MLRIKPASADASASPTAAGMERSKATKARAIAAATAPNTTAIAARKVSALRTNR